MAQTIKEFRLLDNKYLPIVGYALCVAIMIGCMLVCIEFLQYGEPFLRRGDSNARWLMSLYAMGVVCAVAAIGIALSRIYLMVHERRSFKPINY